MKTVSLSSSQQVALECVCFRFLLAKASGSACHGGQQDNLNRVTLIQEQSQVVLPVKIRVLNLSSRLLRKKIIQKHSAPPLVSNPTPK